MPFHRSPNFYMVSPCCIQAGKRANCMCAPCRERHQRCCHRHLRGQTRCCPAQGRYDLNVGHEAARCAHSGDRFLRPTEEAPLSPSYLRPSPPPSLRDPQDPSERIRTPPGGLQEVGVATVRVLAPVYTKTNMATTQVMVKDGIRSKQYPCPQRIGA